MYTTPSIIILLLGLCCTLLAVKASSSNDEEERKSYIVYMGDRPGGDFSPSSQHKRILKEVLGSNGETALLHSYKRSFNGFVVKLTKDEVQKLASKDGVVSVFPNQKKKLHTTRSWDFMGFTQQVIRSTVESDVIIGVIDSGIWPESASFNDSGFGPAPIKWKGTCETTNVTCNNKIIGARFYKSDNTFAAEDIQSPRDSNGHGTHCASTAAGGLVGMASLMGLGMGTARGAVPSARIAAYKVCWSDGCDDSDILAAFDDAIADGVDIVSLSVGGSDPQHYFNDSIAIGTFHAMKNGILTSVSAGNDGPALETTTNVAPWFLSVAASTIDRKFVTNVQLDDNTSYQGLSINTFDPKNTMASLIYGGDAPNTGGGFDSSSSSLCLEDSLDTTLVNGKIVLCDTRNDGKTAFLAGAAGMLAQDESSMDYASLYPLSAANLDLNDYGTVFTYLSQTTNPTGAVLKSVEVNDTTAPFVVSFSSRGPNPVTLNLLKPDIAAPGVDILAATPTIAPVSGVAGDSRVAPYNFKSGTSMACPHVTGVAAYVKSFHPTWSPAAIKSAIMTTAMPMSVDTTPDAEFAYGAGHVNPLKAVDPGLVYDAGFADYVQFLCGQGYNNAALQRVTGDNSTCSAAMSETVWDLNLPSFALAVTPFIPFSQTFTRTVTNVGPPMSNYAVSVTSPDVVSVRVQPSVLNFTSVGQTLSFTVTVQGALDAGFGASASLTWADGTRHQVRSPVVVFTVS